MRKFVGIIIGDGKQKTFKLVHSLGTNNIVFNIHRDGNHDYVAGVKSLSEDIIEISFNEPLKVDEVFTVVVVG